MPAGGREQTLPNGSSRPFAALAIRCCLLRMQPLEMALMPRRRCDSSDSTAGWLRHAEPPALLALRNPAQLEEATEAPNSTPSPPSWRGCDGEGRHAPRRVAPTRLVEAGHLSEHVREALIARVHAHGRDEAAEDAEQLRRLARGEAWAPRITVGPVPQGTGHRCAARGASYCAPLKEPPRTHQTPASCLKSSSAPKVDPTVPLGVSNNQPATW